MTTDNIDRKMRIAMEFTGDVQRLIRFAENKLGRATDADFERIKSLIVISKNEDPFDIINRCKDKIWEYRSHIVAKNINFLDEVKVDKYIKRDQNQRFIETVLQKINAARNAVTEPERETIAKTITHMLGLVAEYKVVTGDFVDS